MRVWLSTRTRLSCFSVLRRLLTMVDSKRRSMKRVKMLYCQYSSRHHRPTQNTYKSPLKNVRPQSSHAAPCSASASAGGEVNVDGVSHLKHKEGLHALLLEQRSKSWLGKQKPVRESMETTVRSADPLKGTRYRRRTPPVFYKSSWHTSLIPACASRWLFCTIYKTMLSLQQ